MIVANSTIYVQGLREIANISGHRSELGTLRIFPDIFELEVSRIFPDIFELEVSRIFPDIFELEVSRIFPDTGLNFRPHEYLLI